VEPIQFRNPSIDAQTKENERFVQFVDKEDGFGILHAIREREQHTCSPQNDRGNRRSGVRKK
jgi:hypothetical protein